LNITEIFRVTGLIGKGSPMTIYRYLKQQHYSWRPITDSFFLMDKHKKDHVLFAREHLNDDWSTTLFIYE